MGKLSKEKKRTNITAGGNTGFGPKGNIFAKNEKESGKPKYELGFNNNFSVNIQVESAIMTADNLPSQLNTAYYRIYTDLPLDTLSYQGEGQDFNCIGVALKNYTTGSFFFSYASSYGITLTKDYPLNTRTNQDSSVLSVITMSQNFLEKKDCLISGTWNIDHPCTPLNSKKGSYCFRYSQRWIDLIFLKTCWKCLL